MKINISEKRFENISEQNNESEFKKKLANASVKDSIIYEKNPLFILNMDNNCFRIGK
ncbi:MAG: hypothetical protein GY756_26820 [bacterium]|nr:hypothetical protein [bacterium]